MPPKRLDHTHTLDAIGVEVCFQSTSRWPKITFLFESSSEDALIDYTSFLACSKTCSAQIVELGQRFFFG